MLTLGRTASHIIDQDQVSELIEAIGIDDFCDIVKTLESEVKSQIDALETRSDADATVDVKKAAHRLAGLLSQFGAFKVTEHADRVREARTSDEVDRLAASMVDLCRASLAAIADLPLGAEGFGKVAR